MPAFPLDKNHANVGLLAWFLPEVLLYPCQQLYRWRGYSPMEYQAEWLARFSLCQTHANGFLLAWVWLCENRDNHGYLKLCSKIGSCQNRQLYLVLSYNIHANVGLLAWMLSYEIPDGGLARFLRFFSMQES
jgi:hypothetical protein